MQERAPVTIVSESITPVARHVRVLPVRGYNGV